MKTDFANTFLFFENKESRVHIRNINFQAKFLKMCVQNKFIESVKEIDFTPKAVRGRNCKDMNVILFLKSMSRALNTYEMLSE